MDEPKATLRARNPRSVLVLAMALIAALVAPLTPVSQRTAEAAESTGLQVIVNERGRISASYAGEGNTSTATSLVVEKPTGATVRRAVLLGATTGFTGATLTAAVQLAGSNVTLENETPNGIGSYNYWTDVTALLSPIIDSASAGNVEIPVVEPSPSSELDGLVLAVIFADPSVQADRSVSLLFGALQTGGDRFTLQLEEPFNPSDPNAHLQMSLGISYSCQEPGSCGSAGQQYSTIDVNGQRLTSAAGGEDDGVSQNGALMTVGGVGDSPDNPSDPWATPTNPRSDDELYNLSPFVGAGDTTVIVETRNPSADDNVFFAAFTGNPPVTVETAPPPGSRCHDAYLLTLRGSGQPYGSSTEMQKITEGIKQTLPVDDLEESEIDYAALGTETLLEGIDRKRPKAWKAIGWADAQIRQLVEVNLPKFLDSARDGTNKLNAELLSIALECRLSPKEPQVFIAGYSQGALAIHELLVQLSRSDVNNYTEMISRVALIADPARAPQSETLALYSTASDSAKSYGACHVLERLPGDLTCGSSLSGPAQDVPATFVDRTVSTCYANDIVCDTSRMVNDHGYNPPARMRMGTNQHTLYKYGDDLVNVGRWLGLGY